MQHELLKNNSASIDHLGIAVKNLQAAKSFYSILGLEISDEEIVEQEQVKLVMVTLGDSRLELLEPLCEDRLSDAFSFAAAKACTTSPCACPISKRVWRN